MLLGGVRSGLLLWALSALVAASAWAAPGSGPRQTIDQTYTTKRPNTPTGLGFSARYHAAGNQKARPPFLRKMVIYRPKGFRFDTSVPTRCGVPDVVLQARGPNACPKGSYLGGGETSGTFLFPFNDDAVFHEFWHELDVFNNANEQVILVESEGWTVVRGRFRPDGSQVFEPTTCFPKVEGVDCADDYVVQLTSKNFLMPYTKRVNGKLKSYATTPPKCPKSGNWRTRVKYWWSNGAVDSVVSKQPCRQPRKR
jgi:hypothetical protein